MKEKKRDEELNQGKLRYRILGCLTCRFLRKKDDDAQKLREMKRASSIEKLSNGDEEKQKQMELMYQVKKLMGQKCEEEVKMNQARKKWAFLRS